MHFVLLPLLAGVVALPTLRVTVLNDYIADEVRVDQQLIDKYAQRSLPSSIFVLVSATCSRFYTIHRAQPLRRQSTMCVADDGAPVDLLALQHNDPLNGLVISG